MAEFPDPIIEFTNVEKRFGGLAAIDGLDLRVSRGRLSGLLGPNGAGKTTVVNLISGLIQADSGQIVIDGHDVSGLAPNRIAALGVARTFQNVRMFEGLSVLDHVVLGLDRWRTSTFVASVFGPPSEHRERKQVVLEAEELLERVGLRIDASRPADTLSYGDQRRVEIARALATRPKLLLLDEPTAGMNSEEYHQLAELFVTLSHEGVSLMVIEHNIELVRTYCDEVTVMNFGQNIAEGPVDECLADPDVREAYFGRAPSEGIEDLVLHAPNDDSATTEQGET